MTQIAPQTLRQLLFDMIRIRMVEESIADRYAEKEMRCPVHLSIGQEAVAVGVCSALSQSDYVFSTHRGHAHYLAKGGNLRTMMAEIYGKANGCAGGRGGSMHLIDLSANMLGCTPIVGSSLPVAVGVAFATWMRGEQHATAVFFGEGATEEGVFAESINFAALKRLPVLFVCENNLYSVYSPMSVRQPAERDRLALARAHGIRAVRGDGNNVEEVHRLSSEAIQALREGRGPYFLEFDTYRWREHCGPNYDNHIGYRTEDEFQEWKKQCPVDFHANKLMAEAHITAQDVVQYRAKIRQEIDDAFAFAKEGPFPSPDDMMRWVYAT